MVGKNWKNTYIGMNEATKNVDDDTTPQMKIIAKQRKTKQVECGRKLSVM